MHRRIRFQLWRIHCLVVSFFLKIVLSALAVSPALIAEEINLFDEFSNDWRSQWREQRLFSKATLYTVDRSERRPALHAISDQANSGLLRRLDLTELPSTVTLHWQWRIRNTLPESHVEQKRSGDDYAARLCVIFEDSIIPLRTRALNYVWSTQVPVDSIFPSPYSKRVGMFVLRCGDKESGQWKSESRNIIADYRRYFGQDPERITAIGIVVDTDNTDSRAETWFTDLILEIPSTIGHE